MQRGTRSRPVFISYSHQDISLVGPVVRLLRAVTPFVFLDSDSIEPGTEWRSELASALARADLVIVFWCKHSCESEEVKGEYLSALNAGKALMPVLLDSTPLPRALARFQWIDFRAIAREAHKTTRHKGTKLSADLAGAAILYYVLWPLLVSLWALIMERLTPGANILFWPLVMLSLIVLPYVLYATAKILQIEWLRDAADAVRHRIEWWWLNLSRPELADASKRMAQVLQKELIQRLSPAV